jgi:hypothetical protein
VVRQLFRHQLLAVVELGGNLQANSSNEVEE